MTLNKVFPKCDLVNTTFIQDHTIFCETISKYNDFHIIAKSLNDFKLDLRRRKTYLKEKHHCCMRHCLFDSFLLSLPVLLVLLLLCATTSFHNLVCTCVLHLSYVYVVTSSCHHSIFVVFTNQSPSDYFTYHNLSHSFF